ncbi:MAG TPA: LamG domain-containing protein, partial [Spirochaetales bacterium]|nr:LamG domain-containing protein [Spirochaetales bacterium]
SADIEIDYDLAFDLDQGYTICGWYWLDSAPLNPNPTIFSKMDITGASQNWWIYADNSGFLTWAWTNANADPPLNYAVNHRDSSWHHFAAVSTSNTHILYIDGLQRAISTTTATTDTPADDLYIGSRIVAAVNTDYWDGKLDDLRIYNRGLSPVEIYEIFNGTDVSWP